MDGKKPARKSKYLLGKISRFLSQHLLLKIAIKCKLTPNILTSMSVIFCILSAAFYSFGSTILNIIAAFFFFLFIVFDHLDGDVARYLGLESIAGELFDSIAGKLAFVLTFLGICAGQMKFYNPEFVWFLGFTIIAGFFAFQSLSFKRQLLKIKNNLVEKQSKQNNKIFKKDSFARTVLREITEMYIFVGYLIIFGSIFNKLYYVLVLSSIYIWLSYCYEVAKSLRAFSKIEGVQN